MELQRAILAAPPPPGATPSGGVGSGDLVPAEGRVGQCRPCRRCRPSSVAPPSWPSCAPRSPTPSARRPRIVQVEGPAGMGKTALIERFLAEPGTEPPPTVLRAGGDEAETLLAYGVVEQLARSAGLEPADGDRRGRAARRPGHRRHPAAAAARPRRRGGPVVVVVDDAHWADRPSLSALLFALRRLVADQVLVADRRAGRGHRAAGGPAQGRRRTAGHRHRAARARRARAARPRGAARRRRCRRWPPGACATARRATRCTPGRCSPSSRRSAWGAGERPLPSPRSFRLLVHDRWAGCSEPARDLVDAAAVLGMHSPLPQVAALAGLDEPLAPLDEATAAGLLAEPAPGTPLTVAFPHPLVRSAVHDSLGRGPAQRAARRRGDAGRGPGGGAAAPRRRGDGPRRRARGRPGGLRPPRGGPAGVARARPRASSRPPGRARPRPTGSGALLEAVTWMLQNGDAASAARAPRRDRRLRAGCPARQRARRARHGRRTARRGGGAAAQGVGGVPRRTPIPSWRPRSRCRTPCTPTAASTARAPSPGAGGRWSAPARTPSRTGRPAPTSPTASATRAAPPSRSPPSPPRTARTTPGWSRARPAARCGWWRTTSTARAPTSPPRRWPRRGWAC